MTFRFALAAASFAVACSLPAIASAAPVSSGVDPKRLALAEQMMKEMDVEHTMHGVFEKMFSSMPMPQTSEFDGAQYGRSMAAGIDAVMPELIENSAQAYAETFTTDELKQYVAFYASPAGQALLKKLPELTQRSLPTVMALMPKMMAAADTDYCNHATCDAVVKNIFKRQEDMAAAVAARQATDADK